MITSIKNPEQYLTNDWPLANLSFLSCIHLFSESVFLFSKLRVKPAEPAGPSFEGSRWIFLIGVRAHFRPFPRPCLCQTLSPLCSHIRLLKLHSQAPVPSGREGLSYNINSVLLSYMSPPLIFSKCKLWGVLHRLTLHSGFQRPPPSTRQAPRWLASLWRVPTRVCVQRLSKSLGSHYMCLSAWSWSTVSKHRTMNRKHWAEGSNAMVTGDMWFLSTQNMASPNWDVL